MEEIDSSDDSDVSDVSDSEVVEDGPGDETEPQAKKKRGRGVWSIIFGSAYLDMGPSYQGGQGTTFPARMP